MRTTVVALLLLLFSVGCVHNPQPTPIPTAHSVKLKIQWSAPVDYFTLLRGSTCSNLVAFRTLPTAAFTDTAVSPGSSYCYAVIAVKGAEQSPRSNTFMAGPIPR